MKITCSKFPSNGQLWVLPSFTGSVENDEPPKRTEVSTYLVLPSFPWPAAAAEATKSRRKHTHTHTHTHRRTELWKVIIGAYGSADVEWPVPARERERGWWGGTGHLSCGVAVGAQTPVLKATTAAATTTTTTTGTPPPAAARAAWTASIIAPAFFVRSAQLLTTFLWDDYTNTLHCSVSHSIECKVHEIHTQIYPFVGFY